MSTIMSHPLYFHLADVYEEYHRLFVLDEKDKYPEVFARGNILVKTIYPSVSNPGINKIEFDYENSLDERLLFEVSYYHEEKGGWRSNFSFHSVYVSPTFYDIKIDVRKADRNGAREIIHNIFFKAMMTQLIYNKEENEYILSGEKLRD
jgi:hypothetical protein